MMHDFATTRRYAVFFDYPLVFELSSLLLGGNALAFRPEQGARIGVLPRDAVDATAMRWFDIKPGFAFHVAASWSEREKEKRLFSSKLVYDVLGIATMW